MFNNQNKQILNQVVNDISNFEESKIDKKIDKDTSGRIKGIYLRINKGKDVFKNITELILKSVMQMSSLDLLIKDKEKKIKGVSSNMQSLMESISHTSEVTVHSSEEVVAAHRDMTESISNLSMNASQLLKDTEKSEEELLHIKNYSDEAINYSIGMNCDMKDLLNVLDNVQGVIKAIYDISEQTNLLALNASIEAARAGESGRGFSVVAEEIKKLANETKSLTTNMSKFVNDIEGASTKSSISVENTVKSLEMINEKLDSVVETSKGNKTTIDKITEEISMVAATSEEISSSMDEVSISVKSFDNDLEVLDKDVEILSDISKSLESIITPVENIETDLHKAATLVGQLVVDPYYRIDNKLFINTIENAIVAHKKWLENLEGMVSSGNESVLQVNDKKCAFGHFYYSIKPENNKITSIWNGIEGNHSKFHAFGKDAINAVRNNDLNTAKSIADNAKKISSKLISDFENIIDIAKELEKENKSVFEA